MKHVLKHVLCNDMTHVLKQVLHRAHDKHVEHIETRGEAHAEAYDESYVTYE